jgi:hypothetical protein
VKGALTLVVFFVALVKLLSKVILEADFINRVQLAFQVVDMLFLVGENFLEQRTAGVVADFGGDLDGIIQVLDRVYLEGEIAFKLRLDVVADIDLPDIAHVGSSVEEKNAIHQLFCVNHLFDRFLAVMGTEAEISPVVAHLAVEEILIDGCELGLEGFAQVFVDSIVSAHGGILAGGEGSFNFAGLGLVTLKGLALQSEEKKWG